MNKVLIIAEAGVNHNGNIEIAKKMVDEAKRCGADIVKFQTFNPKKLASRHAPMTEYQKENLGVVESQEEMLRKLMLQPEEYIKIAGYCRDIGIKFISTPFEIESIHFLNDLQDIWKIPSGEITNYPYLVEIARTGKDVILSTGMSSLHEIDEALEVLRLNGSRKITVLHCTTNYPTPMKEVNLNAMLTIKEHCGCPVGYSDHTKGIEISIAAVAMGAEVIEKHFTLDCNMEGPDHKASLEPDELEAMVSSIRNIELAMGNGIKISSDSEKANSQVVRKSIIALKKIKAGELLTEHNLTTKRPGTGISPMKWNEVLGTRAIHDFDEDDFIEI